MGTKVVVVDAFLRFVVGENLSKIRLMTDLIDL
jgi:hypothetical protein